MAASNRNAQVTFSSFRLAPENLLELLPALHSQLRFHYLMADFWNGDDFFIWYDDALTKLTDRVNDTTQGSAFGDVGELRWRRIGNVLRAALVAEINDQVRQNLSTAIATLKPKLGATNSEHGSLHDETQPIVENYLSREGKVLLWGTDRNAQGAWVETRIPKLLYYPVIPQERRAKDEYSRVEMHHIAYADARGQVVAYRHTHLSAILKPKQSAENLAEESVE
jgi:hypothetical protein